MNWIKLWRELRYYCAVLRWWSSGPTPDGAVDHDWWTEPKPRREHYALHDVRDYRDGSY
jgi:hypothetical protein